MILVVLALIWVLALTPTILRKLAEREGTYSVAKFHRSLRAMRRAYPTQVATAGMGASGMGGLGFPASRAGAMGSGPLSRPAVINGAGSSPAGMGSAEPTVYAAGATGAATQSVTRVGGPSARRRRRVLSVLGGGVFGSFLLGFVPGLGILWVASLLLLALTAGYIGLLIRFRRVALERAQKVVVLDPASAAVAAAAERVAVTRPRIQPFRAGAGAPRREWSIESRPAVAGG